MILDLSPPSGHHLRGRAVRVDPGACPVIRQTDSDPWMDASGKLKAFIRRSGATEQEVTDHAPGSWGGVCPTPVIQWSTRNKPKRYNGSYGNFELKEETWTRLHCMHVT